MESGSFFTTKSDYKEQHFAGVADRGISIAINKWQPLLAVGGLWSMRVWDIQSHKEVGLEQRKFGVGDGMLVEQIAFGDEGQLLAALSVDINIHKISHYSINLWELPSYNLLEQVKVPSARIYRLQISFQRTAYVRRNLRWSSTNMEWEANSVARTFNEL